MRLLPKPPPQRADDDIDGGGVQDDESRDDAHLYALLHTSAEQRLAACVAACARHNINNVKELFALTVLQVMEVIDGTLGDARVMFSGPSKVQATQTLGCTPHTPALFH